MSINTAHAFLNNKVGTRWCLAIVGTRFQTDIDGGILQQRLVLRLYSSKGIDLGMALSTAHMIALTDYSPPLLGGGWGEANHCSHHRIGACTLYTVRCQLQTASHIYFVNDYLAVLHKMIIFAL